MGSHPLAEDPASPLHALKRKVRRPSLPPLRPVFPTSPGPACRPDHDDPVEPRPGSRPGYGGESCVAQSARYPGLERRYKLAVATSDSSFAGHKDEPVDVQADNGLR